MTQTLNTKMAQFTNTSKSKKEKPESVVRPNEAPVVKGKIIAIVEALEAMEDQREIVKGILETLEKDHGIEKKVARDAAKIIYKGDDDKRKAYTKKLNEFMDSLT